MTRDQLTVLLTQTATTLAGPNADLGDDKAVDALVSNAFKIVNAAKKAAVENEK